MQPWRTDQSRLFVNVALQGGKHNETALRSHRAKTVVDQQEHRQSAPTTIVNVVKLVKGDN